MLIKRRTILAAAGTVAVALAPRKPRAALLELSRMMLADPPKPVPAISFLTADGKTRTLADYAGQGVVLNLWATWCVPCVAEMPALNAMAGMLRDARISVLPLSSDHGGAAVVQTFYARHGITDLPVLLDPEGDATRALGARGIPTTLILDRAGREVGRVEGGVDWASQADRVKQLVGQA
jgi:thiol-disulfide isomerase/thioredoxin